jgi:hypothetical protein
MNRVWIGLQNRHASRLRRLAELIQWNRFLGSLKIKKNQALYPAASLHTLMSKFFSWNSNARSRQLNWYWFLSTANLQRRNAQIPCLCTRVVSMHFTYRCWFLNCSLRGAIIERSKTSSSSSIIYSRNNNPNNRIDIFYIIFTYRAIKRALPTPFLTSKTNTLLPPPGCGKIHFDATAPPPTPIPIPIHSCSKTHVHKITNVPVFL